MVEEGLNQFWAQIHEKISIYKLAIVETKLSSIHKRWSEYLT